MYKKLEAIKAFLLENPKICAAKDFLKRNPQVSAGLCALMMVMHQIIY